MNVLDRYGLNSEVSEVASTDDSLESRIDDSSESAKVKEPFRRISDSSVLSKLPLSNYQFPVGKILAIPLVGLTLAFGAYNLKPESTDLGLDNLDLSSIVNSAGSYVTDKVFALAEKYVLEGSDSNSPVSYDLPQK
jgi:hypothetical protein